MLLTLLYYVATVGVYFCIYNILTWGLDIQFGYAGILDFAYIAFMAVGAYITGVFTLGRSGPLSGQTYVLGLHAPFLIALVASALAAGLLGGLVGFVALRRLRSDYMAIAMVALGTVSWDVAGNFTPLFNGWNGLSSVPSPFNGLLKLDPNTYTFFFLGLSIVITAVMWLIASRLSRSPLALVWRAIRDDEKAAEAYGRNVFRYRLVAMVVGCAFAGVAGSLFIGFLGAFNPSGWTTGETFLIWVAMLIGGRGNPIGSVIGAFLIPVLFTQASAFIPTVASNPDLTAALQNAAVGILVILTLRFRPQGILPARRRFYEVGTAGSAIKGAAEVPGVQ